MLFALVWVLLGLGSLASAVVALWVVLSLSRAAAGDGSSLLPWLTAITLTLGIPFALAAWKHQHQPRRISLTMAWLPMAWNTAGLLIASQLVPDIVGAALRGQGAWVASDSVGDSHSATRVMSALGHHAGDLVQPLPPTTVPHRSASALLENPDKDIDISKAISIPLEEQGTAIFVDVGLEGYGGRHSRQTYLFDTGASYTTISTQAAKALGMEIPDDAPVLSFDTAKGRRESRMVYLPALRIGQVRIEGLLVSVCDKCINERHAGLLGQNVMRRFLARIDFMGGRMLLIPRSSEDRPNRAYDIGPMVELKVEGTAEMWGDRVHWVVTVHNRSTVPVRDIVPSVKFTGGPTLYGKVIGEIAPGEIGRSLVKGKVGGGARSQSKGHFKLGLSEAYW